jgi:hypothetical protein
MSRSEQVGKCQAIETKSSGKSQTTFQEWHVLSSDETFCAIVRCDLLDARLTKISNAVANRTQSSEAAPVHMFSGILDVYILKAILWGC